MSSYYYLFSHILTSLHFPSLILQQQQHLTFPHLVDLTHRKMQIFLSCLLLLLTKFLLSLHTLYNSLHLFCLTSSFEQHLIPSPPSSRLLKRNESSLFNFSPDSCSLHVVSCLSMNLIQREIIFLLTLKRVNTEP